MNRAADEPEPARQAIATLREGPLHAALKAWYRQPGDGVEVPVDCSQVDLVRGGLLVEIQTGLPILFVLIILASIVEPNVFWLLGILALFSWMVLVGVVRAEFLRARNFDYVRAARALGVGDITIMFKHVLPNAMVATITFMPFILAGSITTLTSLDFLGFGLPPGSPSLGEMLQQGKSNLQAPWLGISAFVVLSVMLTLLIFIFEAVRDAFDPRKSVTAAPAVAERTQ